MPDVNGVLLAVQIRQIRPGMPVLVMTGYATTALEETPITGALVLKKPFEPAELAEAVHIALNPALPRPQRPNLVVL